MTSNQKITPEPRVVVESLHAGVKKGRNECEERLSTQRREFSRKRHVTREESCSALIAIEVGDTFGSNYSYCKQWRHAHILSLSPPFPSYRKFHSIVPLFRKFYSSPRPSAFCLSIGYFLSDSEALALAKCGTLIYAMESTKRKRVLLTAEQKSQIVSRIEAGETCSRPHCRKNLVLEYQQSGI
ncbi:hypothetical protein AVEN_163947-1 [Araneus ventricosus]|uniref:HTH psq-type domain-containing protein n=1 Tax=Araneus ventricosus TaxID=182803 RepID=A0A4Y2H1H6_ARAVE|nr:hypothetical protein AVEN_163947-1 [Araneus ventricosus]